MAVRARRRERLLLLPLPPPLTPLLAELFAALAQQRAALPHLLARRL